MALTGNPLLKLLVIPVVIGAILIGVIVFAVSRWRKKLHPIWLICISGALGFVFHAALPMIP